MSDRVERLREFVAGYHPEAEALMALLDELKRLREENRQVTANRDSLLLRVEETEDRLHCIEEAARDWLEHPHEQAALNALRAALEEEAS